MSNQCKKNVYKKGVHITAKSGNDYNTPPICTLGTHTDIKHIVVVQNVSTYPVDNIECKGQILANPQKIEFLSSSTGDTSIEWEASIPSIDDGEYYSFDHVKLAPNPSLSGTERIDARVTLNDNYGNQETIQASIYVTT